MSQEVLANGKFERSEILAQGKTNTLFTVKDHPEYLIFRHGDTLANNDSGTRGQIEGKGKLNCELNNLCFTMIQKDEIPTHFVERLSHNESLIYRAEPLPFEVIIRNYADGSFVDKTGAQKGIKLRQPLLEITRKATPKDILVSDNTPVALGWVTDSQFDTIKDYAMRINEMMSELFSRIGYQLVDFKLEFALLNGEVIVADEFSFDTCRSNDKDGHPVDKTAFFTGDDNCERQLQAIAAVKNSMEFFAESRSAHRKAFKTGDEGYLK